MDMAEIMGESEHLALFEAEKDDAAFDRGEATDLGQGDLGISSKDGGTKYSIKTGEKGTREAWCSKEIVRSEGVTTRTASWFDRFGEVPSKEGGSSIGSSSCFSVFVGNIPPTMSHKRLKVWFLEFGRVIDVFVSRRRSKIDDSVFAFVRFKFLVDARRACTKVDGMMVEGCQIVANMARFARGFTDSQFKEVETVAAIKPMPSAFGRWSYSQIVKQGDMAVGMKAGAAVKVFSKLSVEEADFVDDVLGIGLKSRRSRGDFGVKSDWVAGTHLSEAVVRCNLDSISSQGLSEAELRGWEDEDHGDRPMGAICDGPDLRGVELSAVDVELNSAISGSIQEEEHRICNSMVIFSQGESEVENFDSDEIEVLNSMSSNSGEVVIVDVKDIVSSTVQDNSKSGIEKAELRAQVREIVHDALQIGKAMGVKFSARDERMIKRFVVLRQMDKDKWRMNFDDDPDPV